ncbi:MAG: type II toxin-antitoxin system HipA family toxin [Nitrospirae bacterium]|nr:type II toxin-antitoxin system HipA family toxin [Candidatus Manganitrophaceae bacterium]
MNTIVEVKLWGRRIAAVSLNDDAEVAAFEYDSDFALSGIQVSPLMMPLSRRIFTFPELARPTYYGLPGLLADSLPDKFGHALIDAWLATQGRTPEDFNAIERLCYTGARGMGALEFSPAIGPKTQETNAVQIKQLVELASKILNHRSDFQTSFSDPNKAQALSDILRVGTSAGGARAKALIAWNPKTNEVHSGQVPSSFGFEYWLLKFDGVSGNRDKELEDPKGYGRIEYAYAQMAKDCGIEISDCRLFEENGRQHFMTRRFDRLPGGEKLHMQSLCAMGHYDFNLAGAYSYEQALMVIRQLGLPMKTIEEQFRRMVFNIVARNQDDHVKNIAFLMDKTGQWSLSPAFDINYSFNPTGPWTSQHQMTMNGKRDNFTLDDFNRCAKTASMKRGRAKTIIEEVQETVAQWKTYAKTAGVPIFTQEQIQKTLRLQRF